MAAITLDATAFLLMHGIIETTKTKGTGYQTQSCLQYELNGTRLPPNIRLYAPSILGRYYYDHQHTNEFISHIHKQIKYDPIIFETDRYIEYCLKEIHSFEEAHVKSMCDALERAYSQKLGSAIAQPSSVFNQRRSLTREERISWLEGILNKPLVEWNRHDVYIREKRYHIVGSDTVPNSIVFFCSGLSSFPVLSRTLSGNFRMTELNSIDFDINFNSDSNVWTITFRRISKILSFQNITDIVIQAINIVVASSGRSVTVTCNLNLIDFTCSEIAFPQNDECLRRLTPQFLSSIKSPEGSGRVGGKLIYGTIPRDIIQQHQLRRERSPSHIQDHRDIDFPSQDLDSSRSRSRSPRSADLQYQSPEQGPYPVITVLLLGGVASFVDFKLRPTDTAATSVSPPPSTTEDSKHQGVKKEPEEVDGGARARSRRRKKKGRKQITKRRRRASRRLRTKGSSRRTQRKQQ